MLDINDKHCIVIGGGKVAYRKIRSLIEYNAKITVISDKLCNEILELKGQNKISLINRIYQSGDLKGAFLAFAATDNKEVNQKISNEAKAGNISINVIDDTESCSFIVPSKVERGPLTIAISTNGKSPALSKKIREELETIYGEHYSAFIELLEKARIKALQEISNISSRESFFKELVHSGIIEYIKQGMTELAEQELEKILKKYKDC